MQTVQFPSAPDPDEVKDQYVLSQLLMKLGGRLKPM